MYEPSAAQLERLIERNHHDLAADISELKAQLHANAAAAAARLDRYLLTAVYEAGNEARAVRDKAVDVQIGDLKDEITAARRGNRAAILAAIGSFIGAIAFVAVQALLKGGS
jgi:hypothetical protein